MEPIKTLIGKVNTEVIGPIILLLFVLSLVYFFWGVAKYIQGSANEESRKTGQQHMIWGIIGIFIMVSAWAIIQITMSSFGAPTPAGGLPAGLF